MVSFPFDTTPHSFANFGNGQVWTDGLIPLNVMLYFFYNVHKFRVYISSVDGSDNTSNLLPTSIGDDLNLPSSLSGGGVASIGISTRQMQVPPQILIDIAAARKKANLPDASQADQNNLQKLLTQAETTGAPGESKNFLRAIDINTKCAYPIHTFSGNQSSVRLDLGSVRMYGQGQKFPADRTVIPTYNRYSSPLFGPAFWAVSGTVAALNNAYPIGVISLGQDSGNVGYNVTLYGNNPDVSFATGTMYPRELFSDLNLYPPSGPEGTRVQIKVQNDPAVSNPSLKKCFSGFKNVKKVSFNGFDVTDSFSYTSENLGMDNSLHAQVVNETCSVTVPSGARSGYFSFYSESTDNGNQICDQFSVPQKFVVTS